MVSAAVFRCTSCGNCCRSLRVAVTALDVARLAAATGRAAHDLVAWLAPEGVDMTGEPDSFVELSAGRRLMVLSQLAGACQLLGADNRCRAYAARPRDCAAFPFDFAPAPTNETPPANVPARKRLTLLPLDGCEYATDGHNVAAELELADSARWAELRRYQAQVARWNRRAWHRRRLHRSVGSAEQFLEQALREASAALA